MRQTWTTDTAAAGRSGEHCVMDWRRGVFVALVAASLWHLWRQWQLRPVHPADGPIAPTEPVQTEVDATALGWGPMSDNRVLNAFEITHWSGRLRGDARRTSRGAVIAAVTGK
jgi:hypothetical protein